ncbi:hypothetical protein AB1I63_05450 [Streptococcus pneumoniae]
MYMGWPFSSRWYQTTTKKDTQVRDILYLRRKESATRKKFQSYVHDNLAEQLAQISGVTELRTQVYLPWNKATWNTPNVAHDNPKEEQYHALMIIGFSNEEVRKNFYEEIALTLNAELVTYVSALHAYKMEETISFVKNGQRLK